MNLFVHVMFICSVLYYFLLPDSLYVLDKVLFKREVKIQRAKLWTSRVSITSATQESLTALMAFVTNICIL